MSGIIERGAAAMATKRRELIAQPLDRIWPDLMHAAIEAMREPTEAMLEAGDDAGNLNPLGEDQAVYTAMIDAALSTPTKPAGSEG